MQVCGMVSSFSSKAVGCTLFILTLAQVASPEPRGVFAYMDQSELFNLAAITGENTTRSATAVRAQFCLQAAQQKIEFQLCMYRS